MIQTSAASAALRPQRFLLALLLALVALVPAAPTARAASTSVVISQFQVVGATSADEFVELHNIGTTPFDLNGHVLVYRAKTATSDQTLVTWSASTVIPPGGFYLTAAEVTGTPAQGYDGAVTPDVNFSHTGTGKLSVADGGLALRNGVANTGAIVDSVGYGGATNAFVEGTTTPAPGVNASRVRAANACQDSDNNSADFAGANPATPRNSASPAVSCPVVNVAPSIVTQPQSQTVSSGSTATLSVTATGTAPLGYQWYTGAASDTATPIAGATSSSYTTAALTATTSFWARVSNATGNADSATATITVVAAVACPAADDLVSIPALQGTGDTNTANNQTRTVRGVVVADFQGANGQNGFYIQDRDGDGNPLTSDGIFIFVPSANSAWFGFDVTAGEGVQVSGTAKEFNGMTELDTVTNIVKCGANGALAPTSVSLPEQTNGDLERFEGMLVSITQTLTVEQNFFLGRYGQVTLGVGRLFQPTNQFRPGTPEATALADLNNRSLIVLDDGSSRQNVNPTPYIGADGTLRAGDTASNLVGVLDYGAINSNSAIRDYRLQPTQPVSFTRANPRPAAPEPVGGNVRVASANVLNYFTTLDTGTPACYSSTGLTDCRGANTAAEFTRQRTKIISALLTLDADVFGLMEVENNGPTAVGDLVSGLNAIKGTGTYTVAVEPTNDPISDTQRLGGDAIRVAMIYKPGVVTPKGAALSSPDPVFSRAPFAQSFTLNANGAVFSVIVNHFKSKGSCPSSPSDPNADKGDGQGCWNALRVQQAQALLTLIASVKQAAGSDDVLVIGDLNAYGQEDPVATLTGGGLVNELSKRIAKPYSFVFDGLSGYLDHALASASLDGKVTGVSEWHNNADEPSIIDYNTEFKQNPDCPNGASCTSPDLYTPAPFRASDHDPVLIGLNLGGTSSKTVYLPLVAKGP